MSKLTPPKLTPQELANLSDSHGRLFFGRQLLDVPAYTEAVQSALTAKWMEMLEGQEAACVAIDHLHNDRRDGMTEKVFPLVEVGTKLYAAPVPAKAPTVQPLIDAQQDVLNQVRASLRIEDGKSIVEAVSALVLELDLYRIAYPTVPIDTLLGNLAALVESERQHVITDGGEDHP